MVFYLVCLLLPIIYAAFISLGLPDSMLGSAWPTMYQSFGSDLSSAGIVSMLIAFCTVVSSLMCDRLVRKLGTGGLTALSVGTTAAALIGFSFSSRLWMLCLWGIPYGLGAGSVDAALNNYVAVHYKAKHMSWLHCFWGVGASVGPYIMGLCLTNNLGWENGYRSVALIQVILTAILVFSLPLWKKNCTPSESSDKTDAPPYKLTKAVRLPGAWQMLVAFFCYCSLEQLVGLWGASFMIFAKDIGEETAASLIALYYAGITLGRALSGFLTMKFSDRQLVLFGEIIIAVGIAVLALAADTAFVCAGFCLIGLGCAPIYPCFIHQTPEKFGIDASQAMISLQMASAYIGITLSPAFTGFMMENVHMYLFIALALFFAFLMSFMTFFSDSRCKRAKVK